MRIIHPFITLATAFALVTSSVHSQSECTPEDGNYSCAYNESSHSAHWSIYIPIAALVGAAVWFGVADCKKEKYDSSNSKDALGSIANSKRISSSSQYNSYRAKTMLKGNHSH